MPQRASFGVALFSVLALAVIGACSRTPVPNVRPTAAGATAELYGAGLFSTSAWDFFLAWTPDESRVLFCRSDTTFSTYEILETRRIASDRWAPPVTPRFALAGSNADPHITADGRAVYFISNRPLPGEERPRRTYDIWFARLGVDGQWGEAEHLAGPVNVLGVTEWSPAIARNGDLYFGTVRAGGRGGNDLWVSRLEGGVYGVPENLGDSINSAAAEIEPWISPDARLLIFSAAGRPDSVGGYDLYVSERAADGPWRAPRLLGAGVNTAALDFNPSVSPDGQWLYFSSTRAHLGPLGPRFDHPPSAASVSAVGNGQWGDVYRVRLRAPLAPRDSNP